jgi:tRNA(Ile)-lysidine synthase
LKVAFSGGVDSLVLVHALSRLSVSRNWRLSAIHVNHGLHALADDWAGHCRHVCAELDIPLAVERIHVDASAGMGLEAAARRARYECLARHIGTHEVLLTAHHQDDQAETLLLQLMRGAGVHGMAGMPAVTKFSRGLHARPLLGFRRDDLRRYAVDNRLAWIEDSSNLDTRLARNFLRHRVLPMLEGRWPAAVTRLANCAAHAAEAASILDEVAGKDLRSTGVEEGGLSVPVLLRLDEARRNNLLRYWIRRDYGRSPGSLVIRQVQTYLDRMPRTRHAAVRLGLAEIRRYRDRLHIASITGERTVTVGIWDTKSALALPGGNCVLRAVASVGSGLSRERLHGRRLEVRLRAGGEHIRIRGQKHRHSLKKLLQDSGIPPWRRYELPLLYVDGVLSAVGDQWIEDSFAAKPGESGLMLLVERVKPANRG